MNAKAIQFEKFWREKIAQEILQYESQNDQFGSELRSVATAVSFKE